MRVLLKTGELVNIQWHASEPDNPSPAHNVLLTLNQLEHSDKTEGLGVQLSPGDDASALLPQLHRIAVVAIDFTAFMDGRGFSQARYLREAGFKGEIRATGDYIRDQLFYLSKVGVDAFVLPKDADPDDWRRALTDISESYQSNADQPLPLFRRR